MAGPTSPSASGPTFAPPTLPAGWIAQWDGSSKKYYYVQLSTGVSQWDTPTEAVQTGNTPFHATEHPYGTPGQPQPEVITHEDGSQTMRFPDGTMEPILTDGMRGGDGPNGERGLGSMAMNALLGGGKQSGGHNSSSGSHGSNPLGDLASQFLGGGHGGGSGGSHGSGGKPSGAGKLVGQLASNLFSPSSKPSPPQNYHSGNTSGQSSQHQGGLAGAVMGGVANMFGGKPGHGDAQNYGYHNSGSNGGYSGQAPTYQPPGSAGSSGPPVGAAPSYHSTPPNQHQPQHNAQSYHPPPPSGGSPHGHYPPTQAQPSHGQSYGNYSHSPQPPAPGGHGGASYSQHPGYAELPSAHSPQYAPPPGPPPGTYGGPGGHGHGHGHGGHGGHGGPGGAYPGSYQGQPAYGGQSPYGQQQQPHGYGAPY